MERIKRYRRYRSIPIAYDCGLDIWDDANKDTLAGEPADAVFGGMLLKNYECVMSSRTAEDVNMSHEDPSTRR
jgi:hypothetical protein